MAFVILDIIKSHLKWNENVLLAHDQYPLLVPSATGRSFFDQDIYCPKLDSITPTKLIEIETTDQTLPPWLVHVQIPVAATLSSLYTCMSTASSSECVHSAASGSLLAAGYSWW